MIAIETLVLVGVSIVAAIPLALWLVRMDDREREKEIRRSFDWFDDEGI